MLIIILQYLFLFLNFNYLSHCCCCGGTEVKTNTSSNVSYNISNLVPNNELKTKVVSKIKDFIVKYKDESSRQNEDFNEYRDLYNEMTNDIFTKEVTLELISYIDILKEKGFIDALNYIFSQNIVFYMYLRFLNCLGEVKKRNKFYLDVIEKDDTIKIKISVNKAKLSNKCKKIESGEIYVNEEEFKYFRCKGCNDSNCVSCKLRKFLEEQGILERFEKIFKDQGNSSKSDNSVDIKIFIYQSLKEGYKNLDFFRKVQDLNKILDEDFRKCIFTEWALTILFLQRFIKYIYGENGKLNLYRSIFNREYKLLENITQTDLFESTSIFGPVYLDDKIYSLHQLNNFEFFVVKDVKFYRCLSNYIISPNEYNIFSVYFESEQEIDFIPINYKYNKMSGSNSVFGLTNIDEKTGKEKNEIGEHFINHYKFIDEVCKDILKRCFLKKYPSKKIIVEVLDEKYVFGDDDFDTGTYEWKKNLK